MNISSKHHPWHGQRLWEKRDERTENENWNNMEGEGINRKPNTANCVTWDQWTLNQWISVGFDGISSRKIQWKACVIAGFSLYNPGNVGWKFLLPILAKIKQCLHPVALKIAVGDFLFFPHSFTDKTTHNVNFNRTLKVICGKFSPLAHLFFPPDESHTQCVVSDICPTEQVKMVRALSREH